MLHTWKKKRQSLAQNHPHFDPPLRAGQCYTFWCVTQQFFCEPPWHSAIYCVTHFKQYQDSARGEKSRSWIQPGEKSVTYRKKSDTVAIFSGLALTPQKNAVCITFFCNPGGKLAFGTGRRFRQERANYVEPSWPRWEGKGWHCKSARSSRQMPASAVLQFSLPRVSPLRK